MGDFFAFAVLPRGQELLAPGIVQEDGAAFLPVEVLVLQHTVVRQRDAEAICHRGAQFFHQVKGERRAPRTVAVHEADVGIQPYAFQRGSAVVGEQHIGEGE